MILLNGTLRGTNPLKQKPEKLAKKQIMCVSTRPFNQHSKNCETESSTPTSQDILSQMQSLLDKLKLELPGLNAFECQPPSVTVDCVSNNNNGGKVRPCLSLKEI